MSMRNFVLPIFCVASGGMAFAQTDSAARTVADLPAEIEETGERAPSPPPLSSADDGAPVDLATNQYGIGSPASEEQIAQIDIDVMPDGRGLPEGRGTYAEGETLYADRCLACHGENLEGVAELGAPKLVGGRDSLASDQPVKTVESYWPYASTLFDYVHRAMPMDSPGSLTPDEVYALSAYILGQSGITSDDADAVLNAESFAQVTMPNADGFVEDPRGRGQTE
ncbi:cytochrome c [Paracoccus sp. Z330]|uniref:Cytochrome c n=1 Tax=Paracoccus onchidii TaxID=3017813 RepID=A0ABT4ZJV7_9RHOB|nr:cytochrome c [Paracoccus onchidii]MDB6179650.1 cytochrome c [Paracoccus onchidii]